MKKKITTMLLTVALILMLAVSLSACSLFGGSTNSGTDNNGNTIDEGKSDTPIAETEMNLTGDIPFSLENDFYISFEMKSEESSSTNYTAWFTAIRKDNIIYSSYEYDNYATRTDMDNWNPLSFNIEERLLYNGVNYRKSTYSAGAENSANYSEAWNTKVSIGVTMKTTVEYITAFLGGNHSSDTPYKNNQPINTNRIASWLSKRISRKDAGQMASTAVYADGTESINLPSFFNEEDPSCPSLVNFPITVTKYKKMAIDLNTGADTKAMEVKTWGNLVVGANPVNGKTLLSYSITAKYAASATVTQAYFDTVKGYCGFEYPVA